MKKRHSEWIKNFYRWLGSHIAGVLQHTPLTANGLTALRLPAVLGASWLIAFGAGRVALAEAAVLIFLFSMLDAADGELAKRKGTSMVGAWTDIQIDQIGFLALFVSIGWRLSWVPGGGIGWIVATIATLGTMQTVAQLPWFLRHKDTFAPIRHSVQGDVEGPARVGRDPLWHVFKQQVRPHYHNYSLILMIGLVAGSTRISIALLAAFTGFWWLWIAGRAFGAAARYDGADAG